MDQCLKKIFGVAVLGQPIREVFASALEKDYRVYFFDRTDDDQVEVRDISSLDPGDDDDAYLRTLDEQVLPELEKFAPGVIILSAGFDAHRNDPLSATQVSEAGYREMTRRVMDLAASCAGGRILSMLEGGYDLDALAASVQVHLEELRSASPVGPA